MTWTELDEEKHSLADRLKSIAFNDSAQFMRLIGQMVELHVSEKVVDSEVDADTLLDSQREEIKRLNAEVFRLLSELDESLGHVSEASAVIPKLRAEAAQAKMGTTRLVASLVLSNERIEELEMRLAEVDRG